MIRLWEFKEHAIEQELELINEEWFLILPGILIWDSAGFEVIEVNNFMFFINIDMVDLTGNRDAFKIEFLFTKINFSLGSWGTKNVLKGVNSEW